LILEQPPRRDARVREVVGDADDVAARPDHVIHPEFSHVVVKRDGRLENVTANAGPAERERGNTRFGETSVLVSPRLSEGTPFDDSP
jgi:hypothetical protein